MKTFSRFLLAALLAASSSLVTGQSNPVTIGPVWDAFVLSHGKLARDGSITACETKGAKINSRSDCFTPGFIAKDFAPAIVMTGQSLLDIELAGDLPATKKAVFVGIGPSWKQPAPPRGSPLLVDGEFIIYYRVVPK